MADVIDLDGKRRNGALEPPADWLAHVDGGGEPSGVVAAQPIGVTITDVLGRWAKEGPLVRQPTGIAALDAATAGGVAFGDTWIVAGAPDAAKTALVVQIADVWARGGVVVGVLAADAASDADGVVLRLAQRRGYARRAVEDRSADTLKAIARDLAELRLAIYDSVTSIEAAIEDVGRRAAEANARGALIVDSLHAARSDAEDPRAGIREALDTRVRALVGGVRRHRLAGMATAEMSRATYAKPDDPRADAAAGAESRALDYVAAAKLVARRDSREGIYELRVARSKSGGGGTVVYLALDYARMVLTGAPAPEPEPTVDERRAARSDARDEERRRRDEEDDAAARRLRAAMPDASVRAIVAALRSERRCGNDRAQAAELRTRPVAG